MPSLENSEISDATQRLDVNPAGQPVPPARHPRPAPRPDNSRQRSAAAAAKRRRDRNTIIIVGIIAALLLVTVLVVLGINLFRAPEDNGLIRNNVTAAGVNLSGMTKEQAKAALHAATDNTFTKLNMVVRVLDTEVNLAPKDTGVSLNVDAVVDAAYSYGRTEGQPEQSSYTVSILPYLNLNTSYVQQQVAKLGEKYSTTRTPTTFSIRGEAPDFTPGLKDTTRTHQVLTIHKGTAEYGLNTSTLYELIMEAYNTNIFEVVGNCSEITPEPPDFEALYQQYTLYVEPVNASRNPDYSINVEVYGYGITMDALQSIFNQMEYGAVQDVPLSYIAPQYTSDTLDVMFEDVLARFTTTIPSDPLWYYNIQQVCNILNNKYIEADAEFSFNNVVGDPAAGSFKAVSVYIGKQYREVDGGGICQAATALYNCALLSDLEILERHSHSYAPEFVTPGLDAEVYYGTLDLRFKNNTGNPIRISAVITDGKLVVEFSGTDTKNYSVEIIHKTDKIKNPGVVYNTMLPDNPGEYKDGDILIEGITGYDVSIYMRKISKSTGRPLDTEKLINTSYYAKLDQVVVKIQESEPEPEPPVVDPTDPTEPEENPNP